MPETAAVVGIAVQAVVWHLIAIDRLPFWPATTSTFAILGVAALLVGSPACCAATTAMPAVAIGATAGAALYGATRVVVGLASRLAPIRAAVLDVYRRSDETSFAAALALTVLLATPGEELFWRGLVLPELQASTAPILGAVLAWVGYVGVNAATANLPLLAGAIVGGAVWTALGAWSEGVLAPLASHLLWTALMLVWPPSAAREKLAV
jgi:membrane protease YdiL (CAAX protease family)